MKQRIDLPTMLLVSSLTLWCGEETQLQGNRSDLLESAALTTATQWKTEAALGADLGRGISQQDEQKLQTVFREAVGHELSEEEMDRLVSKLSEQMETQQILHAALESFDSRGIVLAVVAFLIGFVWGNRIKSQEGKDNALEIFAQNAPWPIVQYSEEGYPNIWNPKMEKETGYSHQEVIDYYNTQRQKPEVLPEEYSYIIMTLLYKGENLAKVRAYLEKKKETWEGYANVTFTMDTKFGEKTFRWSTAPYQRGDLRMAQHLTDDKEIHIELAKMREFVRKDTLTGAYTRLALFHDMQELLCNKREEDPVNMSMFFLDIDDFKNINDGSGHEIGDIILKNLVQFLHENMRDEDRVYRYWGDEFIILLKSHNLDKIITKMNDMRHKFHSTTFGDRLNVGTSFWVVSFSTGDYTIDDGIGKTESVSKEKVEEITNTLKGKADRYMYAVKYYRLIRDELVSEGKIQEDQPEKNGIGVPQYDEAWKLLWVRVFNDYGDFLITAEQLDIIEWLKKQDKSVTARK